VVTGAFCAPPVLFGLASLAFVGFIAKLLICRVGSKPRFEGA
jgi:hypothetical protein